MPNGGKRPGSGRKKGVPNKVTAQIKAAAQEHGVAALKELVRIMKKGTSEAARIAACKEILDRGYGKAPQAIVGGGDDDKPAFPTEIQFKIVSPTIDRPPSETREEWVARRKRELEGVTRPFSSKSN